MYANKATFPGPEPFSSHTCPRAVPQTEPSRPHNPNCPRCPPSCLRILAYGGLLPGLSSPLLSCPQQPGRKHCQMGGNHRIFCFFLQEKARLFLAPFITNQLCVCVFFICKALCLAGFRHEVKIGALLLNTFAFLPGINFVCIPLPDCLPCLTPGLLTPHK